MAKRTTANSGNPDGYDNPIGLTSAFAPIKPDAKHAASYDSPLGMTGAFGPVGEEEEWGSGGDKWAGFDWDTPADTSEFADGAAFEAFAKEEETRPRGRHAAHAKQPLEDLPDEDEDEPVEDAGPTAQELRAQRMEERLQQSNRTRRGLIIAIVLLVLALGGLGYFVYTVFMQGQAEGEQQTQEQTATPRESISSAAAGKDAETTAVQLADVPNLVELLWLDQNAAIEKLGRGATVTSTREVNEADSAIKLSATVSLTTEPSDSKSGTPTVYFGFDKNGQIIQVGYSASASALGFGTSSFAEAVNNEHIIEKTLGQVGVSVDQGSITLSEDKASYTTYATDGKTAVKERSTFSGQTMVGEQEATWSSVLSYDYTTANLTGNVGDTIRVVYAYVTLNIEPDPAKEPEAEPEA